MKKTILAATALSALMASNAALAQNSDAERAAARLNFQQSDANDDGELNAAEFRAFINANADDDIGRAGMVRRFGAYDRAFSRVDGDGNGSITPAELAEARGD